MRPITQFFRALDDREIETLHDQALAILEDPGMRIENGEILKSLAKRGARVDHGSEVVRFPRGLVEEVIELARKEEEERRRGETPTPAVSNALTFSWHTPFIERTPPVQVSLGGGCPLYYDHDKKTNRHATGEDFLRMVRLAEGIPEIVTVGNAVHYLKEGSEDVPPKMVQIMGAAAVAKHSSKPGCTSIIDRRQLEFLIEIGVIVKGSYDEYIRRPILVNIHDTEPPLRLTRPEAAIVLEMARRKMSIFILPMPLIGISSPVYPIAGAVVGVAEILGVWAAAKAVREDTPVEARLVSGVLNPKNGAACFSAPEAILADLAVAQLFREKYANRCGTGVGLIDSPVPGPLSIFERTLKMCCATLAGEPQFHAGILGGAVVFSPEQLLIDLDIARSQRALMGGIGGGHFDESVDLIREKGIGGLFIDTDHTARRFRESLWIPTLFERLKSTDVRNALAHDPVETAYERWKEIVSKTDMYEIDEAKRRAIDEVVRKASKALSSIDDATE
jgi:trimethylamine--corrinoid protein Co-methyltransferase